MAIEIQVLAQIVDSNTNTILFKREKTTLAYAPEDTPLEGCIAIAAAKLGTTMTEVEADVRDQIKDAEQEME
jgi:hypothetical protein